MYNNVSISGRNCFISISRVVCVMVISEVLINALLINEDTLNLISVAPGPLLLYFFSMGVQGAK